MPLALLEAMAFGLGIIVTPVGGIPEVVGPEEALTVNAGDTDALADAMHSFLEDRGRSAALGGRARSRLEGTFTMEQVASRYETVYRQALQ
jgi:glycosyltransferase involved in cell wall biosynthesis